MRRLGWLSGSPPAESRRILHNQPDG